MALTGEDRFAIIMKRLDGTYIGSYATYEDDKAGHILFNHYQDEEKLLKLIRLGPVYLLREEVDFPKGLTHHMRDGRFEGGMGVELREASNVTVFTYRDKPFCTGYRDSDGSICRRKEAPFIFKDAKRWIAKNGWLSSMFIYDCKTKQWVLYINRSINWANKPGDFRRAKNFIYKKGGTQ